MVLGPRKASCTTTASRQAHLGADPGRWSPSLRQLFRYCKEGGQDTDRVQRQTCSDLPRRSTRAGRCLRDLKPGRPLRATVVRTWRARPPVRGGASSLGRAKFHDSRHTRPTRSIPRSTRSEHGDRRPRQDITWVHKGQGQHLKLLPAGSTSTRAATRSGWPRTARPAGRLIGTVPEGAFCHKRAPSRARQSQRSARAWSTPLPGSSTCGASTRTCAGPGDHRPGIRVRALPEARGGDGQGADGDPSPDRSLGAVITAHAQSAEFTPEYNAGWRAFRTTCCTGVRDQALLPPEWGTIGGATSASTSSMAPRGTSSSTRETTGCQLSPEPDDRRTAPGEPTS